MPYLLKAQTCNTPPAGSDDCFNAPVMSCNLDGYVGTSVGYNTGPMPADFCGIIENNQWFQFVVDEVPVIIRITPSNCTTNEGLQAQLFTTTDCVNLDAASNCASFGNLNTLTVNSAGMLNVGDVAYFMIDGFFGDFCDFEIEVVSGILPEEMAMAQGASICPGTPIQLDASGSATGPNIFYNWTTMDGNIVSGADQLNPTIDQMGTYTFEVTDIESCCTDVIEVEVTQNTDLPEINFEPVDPLNCVTTSTDINTNMDIPTNYDFNWDTADGNITSTTNGPGISVNQAGTYNVTVVNNMTGCSNIGFITVNQDDDDPSVVASADDDLDCITTQTNLNALSADSDLMYAWTGPGGFTSTMPNPIITTGGSYTVVVTALNGCTAEDDVVVNQSVDIPDISAGVSGELNCDDQMVDLQGASTAIGVQFAWTGPNGFTSNQSVVPTNVSGLYTLTVSLPNGCTNTEDVMVTEDIMMPNISLPQPADLDCQNPTSTLMGGSTTTGASFAWTGPNGFTDMVAQPTISDGGTYTLTVTGTNGCSVSLSVTVDQTADLPAVDAGTDETLTCAVTDVMVGGTNSESGPGITYAWTDENGMNLGSDPTLMVSTIGTYTLTVMDASNGCSNSEQVVVIEDVLAPMVDPGSTLTLSCNQNMITSNGTNSSTGPEFTYEWSDEDGNVISTDVNADFIAAGTYTLEITNMTNGCSDMATLDVMLDADAPIAISAMDGEITCIDSEVALTSSGSSSGTNISYEWLDANGNSISTNASVDVSQAGEYTLVVFDANNGCSTSNPITVIENTVTPMVVIEPATDIDCQITESTLDGSNSSSPDGFSAVWLDANGDQVASSITTDVSVAGTYTLILTDDVNGCTADESVTIADNGDDPVAEIDGLDVITCITDMIELNVGNSDSGTDFVYEWFDADGNPIGNGSTLDVNQAGDYTMVVYNQTNGCESDATVTVEENTVAPTAVSVAPETLTCVTTTVTLDASQSSANGNISFEWMDPNGMIIGTEEFANVTVTGDYGLRVIDTDNGCEDLMTVTVDENVEPPEFTLIQPDVITCDNQFAALSFNTPDIDNSGATWFDVNGQTLTTESYVEVMQAGVYELEVVNTSNGCTALAQVEVFEDVVAPEINPAAPGLIDCINEEVSLTASVSNGLSDVEYTWLDAAGNVLGNGENWIVDAAGNYTVRIENNSNGCTEDALIVVMEDTEEPMAVIDFDGTVLNCNVSSLNADGDDSNGNSDLSYTWIDQFQNTIGVSSDVIISNAGNYTLAVTQESNGCTATAEFTVTEDFDEPAIEITSVGTITCVEEVVSISSTANGGVGNFEFQWDETSGGILSGADTDTPEINSPGMYVVTVTDLSNGCTNEMSVEVEEEVELPEAIAEANDILDCITESIILSTEGSAFGPDIVYSWTGANILTGEDTPNPEVSAAGMYHLTVTNTQTGCENETSVEVEENTERPTGAVTVSTSPTCQGISNGEVNILDVIGGTEPYMYALNDPNNYSPNPNVNNLPGGEYQVFVQDASGCEWDTSIFIIEPIEVTVDLGPDLLIELGESVTLSANTTGNVTRTDWTADVGTVPNGGFLTLDVEPLENTLYEVVVTNEHGCTSLDQILVKVETNRNVYFPTAFSPNGDGVNDFFTIFSDDLVIRVIKMQIFDRWGTQLYLKEEFDPNVEDAGWDGFYKGERMQPGVFMYHTVVEFLDGKQGTYKGEFTILE